MSPTEAQLEAFSSAAQRYARRIRNDAKREYARAYLSHIIGIARGSVGIAAEPSYRDCGMLSAMAAQGVRFELHDLAIAAEVMD